MRVLRGNLHVHSQESDGTGSLAEIAGVAAQCGLDFVGINDHHVICGKSQYINGVLFLMGTEFNTCHNHYLAYHTPVSFENKQVKAAPLIEAVKKSGGIGIIAHPFEKGSNIVSFGKRYPWLDWDVQGFDAIELWNLTSQWRDAATSYFRALYLWLFKRHGPFYQGPNPQAMAKWDQLCLCRHVSGLAGSDLHAPIFRVLGLSYRVLDYPMLFSAVNNYVQVEGGNGDAKEDSAALLAALGQGKCWFALRSEEHTSELQSLFCYSWIRRGRHGRGPFFGRRAGMVACSYSSAGKNKTVPQRQTSVTKGNKKNLCNFS